MTTPTATKRSVVCVGEVYSKGSWPRGDLNPDGRTLPHGTVLYAATLTPESASPDIVEILTAWVEESADYWGLSDSKPLVDLIDKHGLVVERCGDWNDPDYFGPGYRLVPKQPTTHTKE